MSPQSKEDLGCTQGPEERQAAVGMLRRTGLALIPGHREHRGDSDKSWNTSRPRGTRERWRPQPQSLQLWLATGRLHERLWQQNAQFGQHRPSRGCMGANQLGAHRLSQHPSTLYQPHFAYRETESQRVQSDFSQSEVNPISYPSQPSHLCPGGTFLKVFRHLQMKIGSHGHSHD